MKQVTQRLRDGHVEVGDVPVPELRPEGALVDVRASLLSGGTERMKVVTARQSLVGKARSRPDQVRQVLDKTRRDGLRDTIAAVRMRLDQPGGLGYSVAGVVLAVGSRVTDLSPGDRVACAGADYAMHADVDYVPGNLCVRLPDGVSFEAGAFTTVGSIALHGVRQADARIGERVAVIGLGLVGQLACQILRAAGCTVIGVDLDEELIESARTQGAIDRGFARGTLDGQLQREAGECDAVVITAATKSADPIELAARLARDRARVVVVGDVGMNVPRAAYYDKELDLRLSRSYGPGRYDSEYEERGLDYPIGYVRWTERRNMAAFVDLIAAGRIDVSGLIRERIPIERAPEAYDRLAQSDSSTLGVVLHYKPTPVPSIREADHEMGVAPVTGSVRAAGVIGAGSFAQRVLIPSLRDAGFSLEAIASARGLSAAAAGKRFGFASVSTVDEVLANPALGLVVIATRHSTHAELAERAHAAGKHVFVEKPPALNIEGLDGLRRARSASGLVLAVGFNRRHAPFAARMRAHVSNRDAPIELLYRVNAAPLEPGHWLNDPQDGGGRLIGEGCHFVDFACWLIDRLPSSVMCTIPPSDGAPAAASQNFTIGLSFADGSMASIVYCAGGSADLAKEYVEAHASGRTAMLDDFQSLTLYEGRKRKRMRSRRQDKGHAGQARNLRESLEGRIVADVDPLDTMAVTFAALHAAETGVIASFSELPQNEAE